MPAALNSAFLQTCSRSYDDCLVRFGKLVAGLSDTQANYKAGPKKWSINECIGHINLSNRQYADKLDAAVKRARDGGVAGGEPYGRGTLVGRMILNNLRAGPKARRVPAPGVFKPRSDLQLAALVEDFQMQVKRLNELAEHADGLPLGKLKFGSPVMAIMRVTAAQAFEMMHLHTNRHLGQAERVKSADGFPA